MKTICPKCSNPGTLLEWNKRNQHGNYIYHKKGSVVPNRHYIDHLTTINIKADIRYSATKSL